VQQAQDRDPHVTAGRSRILQAATLCNIPALFAVRDHEPAAHNLQSRPNQQPLYAPPMPGNPWAETPLGLALARVSRMSLLICGYWLDDCITFAALNALGEGYDIYLVTDASPSLEVGERQMAMMRLVQAGIVPTTTRQAIREWAGEISFALTRSATCVPSLLLRLHQLPPLARMRSANSDRPKKSAQPSAVASYLSSRIFGSAPASSSSAAILMAPLSTVMCSAV
jgi:Isochorismatase family